MRGRYARGSAVRSSGTRPERRVRAAFEWLNVAYRANASDLPGSPDIVSDELRKVVFVHGCFWHVHPGCAWRDRPVPMKSYWHGKLARNVIRDERAARELEALGWEVAVIWECETRDAKALRARLETFLGEAASKSATEGSSMLPDGVGERDVR